MKHTAEYVSPRHPDKLCDQISDAIVDYCLTHDPLSRCAIETMGGHGKITITGEVTTLAPDVPWHARQIAERIAGKQKEVETNIVMQSPEIARGVDTGGAGDQGIMVGYACNETTTKMPMEYELARSLNKYLYDIYKTDGKTQITWNSKTNMVECVLASFQGATADHLKHYILEWIKDCKEKVVFAKGTKSAQIIANPAGDWTVGGFDADAGVTGRKIVVDAYGPRVPVGGGAFSGKDATKVDRSAAYLARYVAVHTLTKSQYRYANECIVKVAYAIGIAEPLDITILVDGIECKVSSIHKQMFKPKEIIDFLHLREPVYENTARDGHFGVGHRWG